MLHRNCKAGHRGCMPFFISNKLKIVQETSRGVIYAIARCLSIFKDLYHADECTLSDSDKTAFGQPSFGVKKGCPLSPLLFAIYLKH